MYAKKGSQQNHFIDVGVENNVGAQVDLVLLQALKHKAVEVG